MCSPHLLPFSSSSLHSSPSALCTSSFLATALFSAHDALEIRGHRRGPDVLPQRSDWRNVREQDTGRCLPFSRLRSSSSLCFSPSALCTSSFLAPALYSAAGRTRLLEPERSAPLSAVRTLFQERTRFLHTKRSQRRRTQRPGAAEVLRRTVIGRRRPRPNRCHKSQPEILSSPR